MYGLVINGAAMQITVRGDQGFDFPIFTSSQGDNPERRNLAIEMVAVLNRDLENIANDIATSDQPQLRPWRKHVNEHRRFGGCTDKECTVCPPGRMTKDKFVLNDGGIPGQEELWSPDPEFNARNGPIWAPDGSGLYESKASGELYLMQRFHQEEPPEMPNASDKCGDPNCGCMGENHNPSTVLGHVDKIEEDESDLKIYGTVTRAVENYAGVGDGPDVGVEEPKVLGIPESSPGAKEI